MPSQNQQGTDTGTYDSDQHRFVDNNSSDMLTKIHPQRLETAKAWLAAANKYGSKDVQEHFYAEIQRLKD